MNDYPIGLPVDELETPILCLDAAALERNIARMAAFFQGRPAKLRPHSKTHKCPTIAWMQLRAGAIGITCAKLGEAEVMARAGIRDILIANQIVGADKIARLVSLAAYTNIIVAVDDPGNAAAISVAAQAKGVCVNVLVEVNVGMNRCGVEPGQPTLALAQQLVTLPGLRLRGIMGYEGHVVMLADAAARRRAAQEAMQQLIATRDLLLQHGLPVEIVSGGGSGTHDTTGDYAGVTEIQAGSYATMDARYKEVGLPFELALTVVARVISVPKPNSAVIDAGLKTLSTDFGAPRLLRPRGWTLQHLSEEHGSLHCEDGAPLKRGDRVEIVPSHGCTTINLHDAYYVTRDGKLEAVWPIAGRGRVR